MEKPTKTDLLAEKISSVLHKEVDDLSEEECYKLSFLIATVAMSELKIREYFYLEIINIAKTVITAIKESTSVTKKKKNILN